MEILICQSCGVILRSRSRPCRGCGAFVTEHSSLSVAHVYEKHGDALAVTLRNDPVVLERTVNYVLGQSLGGNGDYQPDYTVSESYEIHNFDDDTHGNSQPVYETSELQDSDSSDEDNPHPTIYLARRGSYGKQIPPQYLQKPKLSSLAINRRLSSYAVPQYESKQSPAAVQSAAAAAALQSPGSLQAAGSMPPSTPPIDFPNQAKQSAASAFSLFASLRLPESSNSPPENFDYNTDSSFIEEEAAESHNYEPLDAAPHISEAENNELQEDEAEAASNALVDASPAEKQIEISPEDAEAAIEEPTVVPVNSLEEAELADAEQNNSAVHDPLKGIIEEEKPEEENTEEILESLTKADKEKDLPLGTAANTSNTAASLFAVDANEPVNGARPSKGIDESTLAEYDEQENKNEAPFLTEEDDDDEKGKTRAISNAEANFFANEYEQAQSHSPQVKPKRIDFTPALEQAGVKGAAAAELEAQTISGAAEISNAENTINTPTLAEKSSEAQKIRADQKKKRRDETAMHVGGKAISRGTVITISVLSVVIGFPLTVLLCTVTSILDDFPGARKALNLPKQAAAQQQTAQKSPGFQLPFLSMFNQSNKDKEGSEKGKNVKGSSPGKAGAIGTEKLSLEQMEELADKKPVTQSSAGQASPGQQAPGAQQQQGAPAAQGAKGSPAPQAEPPQQTGPQQGAKPGAPAPAQQAAAARSSYPNSLTGQWEYVFQNPNGQLTRGVMKLTQKGTQFLGAGIDSNGDFKIKGSLLQAGEVKFLKRYIRDGKPVGKIITYQAKISLAPTGQGTPPTLAMTGSWQLTKKVGAGASLKTKLQGGRFEAKLLAAMAPIGSPAAGQAPALNGSGGAQQAGVAPANNPAAPAMQPANGIMQNAMPQNGMMQNGMPANGMMQNGMPPNGMMQNGTPANSMMQSGTPANSMMQNSMPPNGMMQSGTPANSMMQNGMPANSMAPNGMPPNMMPTPDAAQQSSNQPIDKDPKKAHGFFLNIALGIIAIGVGLAMASLKFFGPSGMLNIWAKKEYIPSQFKSQHFKMVKEMGKPLQPGGIPLGKRDDWGLHQFWLPKTLSLPPEERQKNPHLFVIGAGATGKTRLVANMISHDILSKERAVVVVDSDGHLVDLLLNWIASQATGARLAKRVILVDPTSKGNPICYNPLQFPDDGDLQNSASAIVFGFKAAYTEPPGSQSQWNQQTANILRNAAILLMANNKTFTDLPPLLSDNDFRDLMLQTVEARKNERSEYITLIDAWSNYKRLARTDQWINWIEPILNRAQPMLSDPRLRAILTKAESELDLKQIISQKQILLVKIPQGQLDKNGNLLGSLLVSGIKQAALSLSAKSKKPHPCSLYLDEFDSFIEKETFDAITTETRKLQIGFCGVAKTLQTLPEDFRNQVVINVGTMAVFALAKKDGDLLGPQMFRVDGRKVKHQTIQNVFNKVNSSFNFELIMDEEKLNIDRIVGQEKQTYFCYRVGSVAGVFRMKAPEFADIEHDKVNLDLIEKMHSNRQSDGAADEEDDDDDTSFSVSQSKSKPSKSQEHETNDEAAESQPESEDHDDEDEDEEEDKPKESKSSGMSALEKARARARRREQEEKESAREKAALAKKRAGDKVEDDEDDEELTDEAEEDDADASSKRKRSKRALKN